MFFPVLTGIVESIRHAGRFCRRRCMAGMTAVHPEHGTAHDRMYSGPAFPISVCRTHTAKAALRFAVSCNGGRQTRRSRWQAWHPDAAQATFRQHRHISRAECHAGNGAVHRHDAIAYHIQAYVRKNSPDSGNEFQSSWYRWKRVCHTITRLLQEIIQAVFPDYVHWLSGPFGMAFSQDR